MEDTQLLINKSIVVLACFLFTVWVIYWIASLSEKNKKIKELAEQKYLLEKEEIKLGGLIKQQKSDFDARVSEITLKAKNWAIDELEKFKKMEVENIKKSLEDNATQKAVLLLQKWKIENEAKIRIDARNKSYGVTMGKIAEQLVPFHAKFPFNPKDVRFIGSPIDLIVFDGTADEMDKVEIYFIEVKTGKGRLNSRQTAIKSAVQNKDVFWLEINNDAT